MDERPENTTSREEKYSFNWRLFILWPFLIMLLYVLSSGPFILLYDRDYIPAKFEAVKLIYLPLGWAYQRTSLHKPLGIYLHFWDPDSYDKNGESKVRM
jgi:hypothetical protein